jgi:hypothetical protein
VSAQGQQQTSWPYDGSVRSAPLSGRLSADPSATAMGQKLTFG